MTSAVEIAERDGAITFAVRVAPRASRNAIEVAHGGALKVRLTATPLDGRAKGALRRILADRLNVSIAAVRIVSGEKSRTKRITVSGVSRAQIAAIFDSNLP
jgi:uncharacterized protein (TIGR00251 family)